ncbi:MAG: hypothetical protein C4534_01925 [Gaiellales bacterium]|nr:MAG: hypothetical protein C4534_01925 [Gaiellales bacterium]
MSGRSFRQRMLIAGHLLLLVLAACLGVSRQAAAVTAGDSLAGSSGITPAQMEAELRSRNPNHIHPTIADVYGAWGSRFGIRSDLAFAQMLHETGFLRYGGLVQPWQNNFAGIGATGPGNPGRSYPSMNDGVYAHYALLDYYIYVRGIRTLGGLGGTWAVPGHGYGDRIAVYANEMRNYSPAGYWKGNFNETPGVPAARQSTVYYFPWYDNYRPWGFEGDWIIIDNRGMETARVRLTIGSSVVRDPLHPERDYWEVPAAGVITPAAPGVTGGPVKVESLDSQPIMASQRVLYRDSFSEIAGIPAEDLSDTWIFSWYDQRSAGMKNWVLVANMGSQPADVEIRIGGSLVAAYTAAEGTAIQPGQRVTPSFPGLMDGPVEVRSVNGQPLIASQRVIFRESFNETIGDPTAGNSQYLFPWYDSSRANGMYGDWLLITNRDSAPADVDVYISGQLKASYREANGNAIPAGGQVTPAFAGVTGGPVEVRSVNGRRLHVSQRVVFRDSMEEIPGQLFPSPVGLNAEKWFGWYDSRTASSMWGDWIMLVNMGEGDATVYVSLNGGRLRDPANQANDYFTVPEGQVLPLQFRNTAGGHISVLSDHQVLVSQRVLYKYQVSGCGC